MNKINFLKTKKPSYESVRKNINSQITKHLDAKQISESKKFNSKKVVNFTLFIRDEADVLMSHGVADENYFSMRENKKRIVNRFTHILVPGPWLKKKLLKIPGVTIPEKTSISLAGQD